MSLKKFAKYKIDKKASSEIHGAGYGMVICSDGTTFAAGAESMESVHRGDRWCQDHGHGGAITYVFMSEAGEVEVQ